MSEQDKLEPGNELDSSLSQPENCILNKTESSEVDEKEEYGKSDQVIRIGIYFLINLSVFSHFNFIRCYNFRYPLFIFKF